MTKRRRTESELQEIDALVERLREFLRFNYVTSTEVARRLGCKRGSELPPGLKAFPSELSLTVAPIILHPPESGSVQFSAVHALFLCPPALYVFRITDNHRSIALSDNRKAHG
jgi:hypothetical protein